MSNYYTFIIMKKESFAEMLEQMKDLFPIKKSCYELPSCKALEVGWCICGNDKESLKICELLQKKRIKAHILDEKGLADGKLSPQALEKLKETLKTMQKVFMGQSSAIICPPSFYQKEIKPFEFEDMYCISSQVWADYLKEMYSSRLEDCQENAKKFHKEAFFDNTLNHGVIKKYKYLIIYGDALTSGIYAVYAANEIKRLYGEEPGIIIVHHHSVTKRKDSLAAKQMLEQLQAKVINIIDDEDMENIDESNLLFVPQHRVIYAQANISPKTDIYTIPENEVRLYDYDLAVYYVDCSMEIFRQRQQNKVMTKKWKKFLKEYFSCKEETALNAERIINTLINEHKAKLHLLYGI